MMKQRITITAITTRYSNFENRSSGFPIFRAEGARSRKPALNEEAGVQRHGCAEINKTRGHLDPRSMKKQTHLEARGQPREGAIERFTNERKYAAKYARPISSSESFSEKYFDAFSRVKPIKRQASSRFSSERYSS